MRQKAKIQVVNSYQKYLNLEFLISRNQKGEKCLQLKPPPDSMALPRQSEMNNTAKGLDHPAVKISNFAVLFFFILFNYLFI